MNEKPRRAVTQTAPKLPSWRCLLGFAAVSMFLYRPLRRGAACCEERRPLGRSFSATTQVRRRRRVDIASVLALARVVGNILNLENAPCKFFFQAKMSSTRWASRSCNVQRRSSASVAWFRRTRAHAGGSSELCAISVDKVRAASSCVPASLLPRVVELRCSTGHRARSYRRWRPMKKEFRKKTRPLSMTCCKQTI